MATPQMIVLDQALAEVEAPQPDPASWASQLTGAARQLRAALGRHRDTSPCPIDLPSASGGRALRFHERVLAIMRAGGLPDGRSVAGLYLPEQTRQVTPLKRLTPPQPSKPAHGAAFKLPGSYTTVPV